MYLQRQQTAIIEALTEDLSLKIAARLNMYTTMGCSDSAWGFLLAAHSHRGEDEVSREGEWLQARQHENSTTTSPCHLRSSHEQFFSPDFSGAITFFLLRSPVP